MPQSSDTPMRNITRHRKEGHLQEYAEQSRRANQFNDVSIKVGKYSFPAHRLVLACYSKFFERLFLTPMNEQSDGIVKLKKLDGEAVQLLIDYMYVGSITIDQNNVFSLLATANFLQMDDACQFCFDFLEVIISTENWSKILIALHSYRNDYLLKQLRQFISANFAYISISENFKQLKIEDLISIVKKLNRNEVKETSIYEAMSGWIRYDETNRKNSISELLSLIDLHKLPSDFLEDVVAADPLVKESFICLKSVMSAITKQFKEMRSKERGSKLITVVGAANPRKVTEIHNFSGSTKSVYPDLPSPAYYSKSLELNGCIYSIGGSSQLEVNEDMDITSKVHRMNVNDSEMKWEEVCPLNEGRCAMGATVFKDCLVVAGGAEAKDKTYTREETYIPALNKWQQIAKLKQERLFNELVSCNSCLFAIGGLVKHQYLSSVEKLSDFDGEWKTVTPMNVPRASFAAVCCRGEIYAIGGWNKSDDGNKIPTSSVEKYNPVRKKWTFVRSMSTERAGHAACDRRDKIFVVGGFDANKEPLKAIECYDPLTDKWDAIGDTKEKLVCHSLIVV